GLRARGPRRAPRGTPRATAAARGYAGRHRGSDGSRRSRLGAARPSRSRARSWTAGQFVCPAGRAPRSRRWWSTVRDVESGPSDGQPCPPLRATTLENFAPALGLHPLAEPVGLLPPSHIGLKRPLHEARSPPVIE